MIYALNLSSDNRILSATYDQYAPASQPRVEYLPEGDISDYLYVNGEYVYDPLPVPDNTPTALRNYEIGEFFEQDGTLYEATASIPRGERLNIGDNCIVTTYAEQLNKQGE